MVILKNNKFITVTILTGIVMVMWQLLAGPLNYRFQLIFFICSMFTLGIPHGAFDYLVEREVYRRNKTSFRGFIFRSKYLATITIYGLFWYLIPQLSLLAFLLFSSWHFGETDLKEIKTLPLLSSLLRLVYGISVLIWIIFGHASESQTIITHLISPGSFSIKLWIAAFIHTKIILSISGFILFATLIFNQLKGYSKNRVLPFIQLIIILICCYYLPLLPAFVLYFVGWHSVITLNKIKDFINEDMIYKVPLTTLNLISKALPASLMSIGVLLLTGLVFRHYAPIFDPLPLLFVFLSLITLPHMQVMNKLNKFPNFNEDENEIVVVN